MTPKDLDTMLIGEARDWKYGLITRDVYKISENLFELTDLSSGWVNAVVDKATMILLLSGMKNIMDLDWK